MTPGDFTRVLGCGLFCTALFHLSVLQSANGNVSIFRRVLQKLGATERQMEDLLRPLFSVPTTEYTQNVRIKRQDATTVRVSPGHSNATTNATAVSVSPGHSNATTNATTVSESPGHSNATTNATTVSVSPGAGTTSTAGNATTASTNQTPAVPIVATSVTPGNMSSTPNATTRNSSSTTEYDEDEIGEVVSGESRSPRYSLPTLPPFDRDVARLPERQGEDQAIVETRPNLIHPPFTTYMLIVTIPCVVGWCLLIFVCLWICRPNSPLYRELLKRLIEHSYMKQKSVLFSATVLAADRHAPVTDGGEGPSHKKT